MELKKKAKAVAAKGMRQDDFMAQPQVGWLHESRLLGHGKGVFFCFPVLYIGSVQVNVSLSTIQPDQKTDLCR